MSEFCKKKWQSEYYVYSYAVKHFKHHFFSPFQPHLRWICCAKKYRKSYLDFAVMKTRMITTRCIIVCPTQDCARRPLCNRLNISFSMQSQVQVQFQARLIITEQREISIKKSIIFPRDMNSICLVEFQQGLHKSCGQKGVIGA